MAKNCRKKFNAINTPTLVVSINVYVAYIVKIGINHH
jgi:hypothetical protein